MTRGYAVVLTLLVLASALFAALVGATRASYFPPELVGTPSGCQSGVNILDRAERDRLAAELRALREPPLYRQSIEAPFQSSIRFAYLPDAAASAAVRVDWHGSGATLTASRRTDGVYRSPAAAADVQTITRELTPSELKDIQAIFERTQLFRQPSAICDHGVQGATWLVEGTGDAAPFTFIQRQDPRDGPVHQFGLHMLALVGWTPSMIV